MIVSTDKNVYMKKACVYRKDMYLRTRHVYTDETLRIFCPMLLYRSEDKNGVYGVFISTQWQDLSIVSKIYSYFGFYKWCLSANKTFIWHSL